MNHRLVIAKSSEGRFLFACPYCHVRLQAPSLTLRQRFSCPKEQCGSEFEVATEKQLKQEEEDVRKRRQEIDRRVAEMLQRGETPADRISVFGVSSSGKSVYLASLYAYLWSSKDELSGRALHGDDHAHLLTEHARLARGEWLDATNRTRPFDLSINYRGVRATLSSLDYPGEVFTDVFFRKRFDSPDRERLYRQLQTTMGAMLLIDPEQIAGDSSGQYRLDVEFAGIELAEYLTMRGIGDCLVIVLTKRNQNKCVVDECGGARAFVARHMPRLAAAAPSSPVFHISAVGTRVDDRGDRFPTFDQFDYGVVARPLEKLFQRIDPAHLELLQEIDRQAFRSADRHEGQPPAQPDARPRPDPGVDHDDLDDPRAGVMSK